MKRFLTTLSFVFLFFSMSFSQTAEEFFNKKDYHNAAIRYEIEVANNPEGYLNLGKSYFALKEFDKATEAYRNYKNKFSGADRDYMNKLIQLLERDDDYVEVTNVGSIINSGITEAVPRISNDGNVLYFKSQDRPGGSGGEDIWFSTKNADGTWKSPTPFRDLNTDSHEALYSIAGGQNVAVLYGNYEGSFGGGDLFYSVNTPDGWTMPCNLGGTINTSAWESQASLAPDGKTLLYVTEREGGQGEEDIWVTVLSSNGWSVPENLGPKVNTSKSEFRPTMAADGKTLYFASYGHFGFGETDIFVSRKIGDSWQDWSEPVNLGKYINTMDSDEDLSLPNSGIKAYTVKYNATDGYGDYDIYSFIVPPAMRPEQVFKVYGHVTNEVDSAIAVIIRYLDAETGVEMAKAVSNINDGYYEVALPPFKKYEVIIDMKGYLYYTDMLDLTNPDSFKNDVRLNEKLSSEQAKIQAAKTKFENYNVDLQNLLNKNSDNIYEGFKEFEHLAELYRINSKNLDMAVKRAKLKWLSEEDTNLEIENDYQLTTIQIGAKFELKNIFFDFGKASLTEDSKLELNKLVDIMNRSDIIIELGGHTDDVGSAESNKLLSQDRVNSVRDYLVSNGVESVRIAAIGYGEDRPIASNETDEGRQKNRRVEVQITDIRPREGADIVTAADLNKEKEEELEEFDFLSTLQYAARKGGLPDDSPCSDKVSYLYSGNNEPTPVKTTPTYTPGTGWLSNLDELDKSNYIYKSFNPSYMNYGFGDYGGLSGVGVNILNEKLHEYHGEYFFLGDENLKMQIGLGALWNWNLSKLVKLPITLHYGVDLNMVFVDSAFYGDMLEEKDGFAYLTVPLGIRYSHEISEDFVVGPELMYNWGHKVKDAFDAKSTFMRFGVNARWKFIQGGLFFNKGDLVDYIGLRAGFAF